MNYKIFSIIIFLLLIASITIAQSPSWIMSIPRITSNYNDLKEADDSEEEQAIKKDLATVIIESEIDKYRNYIAEMRKNIKSAKGDVKPLDKIEELLVKREELRSSGTKANLALAEDLGKEIEKRINIFTNNLRSSNVKKFKDIILSLTLFVNYELRHQSGNITDPLHIERGVVKDRRVLFSYFGKIEEQVIKAEKELLRVYPIKMPYYLGGKTYQDLAGNLKSIRTALNQLQSDVESGVDDPDFWKDFYGRLLALQRIIDIERVEKNGLYSRLIYNKAGSAAEAIVEAGNSIEALLFFLPTTYADLDEWPYLGKESKIAKLRKENDELSEDIVGKEEVIEKVEEIIMEKEKQMQEFIGENDLLKKKLLELDLKNKIKEEEIKKLYEQK